MSEARNQPIGHDLPCPGCGHALHVFDRCDHSRAEAARVCPCPPTALPGSALPTLPRTPGDHRLAA